MRDREFRVQILDTPQQWQSGLPVGLNVDASGLSLFATPSFETWLDRSGAGGDIVTDECGQTWWIALDATSHWTLFRNDPGTKETERVITLHDCDDIKPRKLWLTRDHLLIFDERRARILGLSRANYQILFEVSADQRELIDIDFDRRSAFQSLSRREGQFWLCPLPMPPADVSDRQCRVLKDAHDPVALAVSPEGWIYVLDAGLGRFLRLRPDQEKPDQLAAPSEKILKHFKPSVFEIDSRGVVFLASSSPAKLYQFDADGSRIGETNLPKEIGAVTGIGFDKHKGVYIATDRGLARFNLNITPVGQSGVYYCRALDNGEPEGLWHRLEFTGTLPLKTSVEVSYYASGETALKVAHDHVLDSNDSTEQKQEEIEKLLKPLWNRPGMRAGTKDEEPGEIFRGLLSPEDITSKPAGSPHDMLFLHNKGRFLYLKLRLTTFDEKNRPLVRSARVFYPRKSYLRYLPPVYREDAASAAFLERFLPLFETVFEGIEEEITGLFRYFDPQWGRREFLPWLASWINLTIDENLPEDRIRQLVLSAPEIFSRKGTPFALTRFLEIYTGKRVILVEHSRMIRPLVLGAGLPIGLRTILMRSGKDGFHLGDTSVLGHAVLRAGAPAPEEAFLSFVRRFSIFVDLDREDFVRRKETLQRIIDEQKPAHTICSIGVISAHNRVGMAQLGINCTVTESQPYRVGLSPLGEASAIAKGPPAPRIERGGRFGGRERI